VRYAGLQRAQPALDAGEVIARTQVLKRQQAWPVRLCREPTGVGARRHRDGQP